MEPLIRPTSNVYTPSRSLRSVMRSLRRKGASARQQRKAYKYARREVKVTKELERWRGLGIALADSPGEFAWLMQNDRRAFRGEPPMTAKGTRSSTGHKIATDVPQDKQNTRICSAARALTQRDGTR